MSTLVITVAADMTLAGVVYLYAGAKQQHRGVLLGGVAWMLGAYLAYRFGNLWPLPAAYLAALMLNKNPEH